MARLVPFNKRNAMSRRGGFEDFYNVLDDFFSDSWTANRSLSNDTFKMDIAEKEDEYVIEAELPGVKKNEINLELNEGRLRVSIQREEKEEKEEKNYIHRERRYSSMARSVYLGDIEEDDIKAKLEEGVLCITVPKSEEKDKNKKIPIE